MNTELIEKITSKKEFSRLPKRDVEMALEKFEKKNLNDWQKIKMTRQFLRKIYSSFSSRKVFSESGKKKSAEWYLLKHKSSKERFSHYRGIYSRCLSGFKEGSVIDLGAGINGLSFTREFLPEKTKFSYLGIEAIGQFVDLMNDFFRKNKIDGKAEHFSLFEKEKILSAIENSRRPRIILLFKVVDSLEIVKRDYSKELISDIAPHADRIAVSFATRSLGNRKKFSAKRSWLTNFIEENFKIEDDFEAEGERYLVFKNAS